MDRTRRVAAAIAVAGVTVLCTAGVAMAGDYDSSGGGDDNDGGHHHHHHHHHHGRGENTSSSEEASMSSTGNAPGGGMAVIRPQSLTVNEGSAANAANLLAGDSATSGGTLSVSSFTGSDGRAVAPMAGTVVFGRYGTVIFTDSNGHITYTPTVTNLPTGQTDIDTFQFTVLDSGTGKTTTVNLTVTIDGVSLMP